MIDLYYWPTPNGWKISIALEEMELPYEVKWVDIGRGEQFEPAFLEISPNNRMPAIVDRDPVGGGGPLAIFESGAILVYLAEKSGRFLPSDPRARSEVLQWLFWQVGGLGPMLGQHGHFLLYAEEKIPYAIERYGQETRRLYGVMDRRLAGHEYLAGPYSITDMASWPWVVTWKRQGIDLAGEFPNLRRWYDALKERPALRRGYDLGKEGRKQLTSGPDAEGRRHLFGGEPRAR
ncbi:MAG: thiol:disulfide oxidoreductase [Deltaproteobacteria bacterium]|jgi:GST-like protein|nr:thiol:disulfide oxidoreductase [Deltaproteobacteria bacterium]